MNVDFSNPASWSAAQRYSTRLSGGAVRSLDFIAREYAPRPPPRCRVNCALRALYAEFTWAPPEAEPVPGGEPPIRRTQCWFRGVSVDLSGLGAPSPDASPSIPDSAPIVPMHRPPPWIHRERPEAMAHLRGVVFDWPDWGSSAPDSSGVPWSEA